MNSFEMKAKIYEVINTKMPKIPFDLDSIGQVISDTLTLNFMEFRNTESFFSISGDKNRESEFIASMEVIVNEEVCHLSNYIYLKLSDLFAAEYGGLRYNSAIIDFHNIDAEEKRIRNLGYNEGDVQKYISTASLIITSKSKGVFTVSGLEVYILESGTLARTNIAGINFLLLRADGDDFTGDNIIPFNR